MMCLSFDIFLNLTDEWSELVKALIHFEFDDSAYAFQEKVHSFFKLVETSRTEIWDRTAPTSLNEIVSDRVWKDPSDFFN